MKSTIKEVAEKAGVSIATVSRVFNNSSIVVEETRNRILKVAEELRYSPNHLARSLSSQRTESIGMLLPDLYGEFFSEVIRGVDDKVQFHQHHLVVSSSHNKKDEIEAALRMMRGRVDGLIIMSPDVDTKILNNNLPSKLPVVLLNCFVDDVGRDSITIDNIGGAYQIVRHLIHHRHERIAIVKGPEKNRDAVQRYDGFLKAIQESQLPFDSHLIFRGDFTEAAGYDAVKSMLMMKNRPTAIFASNDTMAIGVISALEEHGIKVPEDIAVVGFDDIPISRYFNPKLSTVHVPINQLGKQAAEMLFHAVTNPTNHQTQHRIVPLGLSIRESCGKHL